ncbi:MAG: tricarboxylate transporter [Lachnospiraceae bacterium]|nr:tricarboxylate transporter [Lachnospiraceae bacterium]
METLSYLLSGFQTALTFQNIGAAAIGAILGIIVGAMPGIGSLVGVALLLPLTYAFNPTTAIIMLGAIYYANMFGGAFSSILINVPGDAPAIMTALDGYPLARKGKPGKALMVANMSSFLGGLLGMVVLTFFGPALAQFGLKFGPAEMTTLMLVALSSISWLIEGNVMKGLAVTCIGILIATIGISTNTGEARYTFGVLHLLSGVNFIPLVVGFIGMAQVFNLLGQEERGNDLVVKKLSIADCKLNKEDFSRMGAPVVRSGLLGSVIGFIPGAGATMASIVSYTIQKKSKKNKEKLGTGAIEGIAASEAANNGAAAGAFGPLLALGIPGSGTTAVLLGGLMMWGLQPGPRLFTDSPDFAWGLISSLYVSNIIALLLALIMIPLIMKVICIPNKILIPTITVICFVGAYASTTSMWGVLIMIIGGIMGYIFQRFGYSASPMLLATILSVTFEVNLRRALNISGGSLSIFVTKPLSLIFLLIFVGLLFSPVIKKAYRKAKAQKA